MNLKEGLREFKKLQEKCHPDSLDFQHCMGYLVQALRNNSEYSRYDRPHTIMEGDNAIAYTTKSQSRTPYVIVSGVGKNVGGFIAREAQNLSNDSKDDVIVKNVGEDLELRLKEEGFEDYGDGENWDEHSKYDDNTFPQQVIDLEIYNPWGGSDYSKLREELKRFHRDYSVVLKRVEDTPESTKNFRTLLSLWAQQMFERKSIREMDLFVSQVMFSPGNFDIQYEFNDSETGDLVGFLSFDEISRSCLGLNAIINDFSYWNSYRFMTHTATNIAKEHGYRYLNLQGSEDAGQYQSKRRFKAQIEIPKKHLVYRYS